ncbi:MAG: lipoate--protein ligase family protein [Cyanobacteria bacterium SIG32]|nr:lipoate--protein ligase family protein [Cyanobacteria bacterium SIG32]
MIFVPFETKTGAENMQIDSDLLDYAIKEQIQEPIFRLYAWEPACISLGRNQKDDFLDFEFLKSKNIDVVKRLTGGRALLHDNEITYSYICPVTSLKNGSNVTESYKEICQFLINGFKKLGIELTLGGEKGVNTKFDYCMLISTGADLCYKGKKFIGSAQCRKEGYILQHGSILYDYDRNLLEEIFNEKVETDSIISVKEINPNLTKQDILNIFCENIANK